VDEISFECKPGRVFSLLGPNGAGKTTTLRMLAGIIQPSSGHVIVDGITVSTSSNEVKKRMRKETLFDRLGIHEFRKKRVGQLSTGMKQKVSIARTLIHDPQVLIFDEPTSGLDVITAENIIDLIKESKQNNKTVIFSSHIMSEVDLLCDDLAIINQGKIIFNNTFQKFKDEMKAENLTQEFINRVKQA